MKKPKNHNDNGMITMKILMPENRTVDGSLGFALQVLFTLLLLIASIDNVYAAASCPTNMSAISQTGNATSASSSGSVNNNSQATGAPTGSGTASTSNSAKLAASGGTLTLDLGTIIPGGIAISLSMARTSSSSRAVVSTSLNNSSYSSTTTLSSASSSNNVLAYRTYTIPTGGARYIRLAYSGAAMWVDGLSYSQICQTSCSMTVTTTSDSNNAANNTGSLRDAIECANDTSGADTISFNIPTTDSGYTNPDGVANNGDEYWAIQLGSQLPSLTDAVTIDGRTQTTNKGNKNSGTVAAATTVGTGSVALAAVNAPEIVLKGYNWITAGFDIRANNVKLYGMGMTTFDTSIRFDQDNVTGAVIDGMALGANPVNGGDIWPTIRNNQHIAVDASNIGFTLTNSLLAYTEINRGIVTGQYKNVSNVTASITGNHFTGIGKSRTSDNGAIEILRTQSPNIQIVGNRFVGIGAGTASDLAVEFNDFGGGNVTCVSCLVQNNDISGFHDGIGYFTDASMTGLDIRNNRIHDVTEFAVFLGNVQSSTVYQNELYNNGKSGVLINKNPALNNTISQNSIYNNGQVGINLSSTSDPTGAGMTINDANDADSGPNNLLNFPIFADISITGSNLTVKGCAPAGAKIELFEADVSPGGAATAGANKFSMTTDYGEGQRYLTTLTEASGSDTDSATCALPTDADGNISTGMKAFSFTIATPSGVVLNDVLTATSTLTGTGTSEFSPTRIVRDGAVLAGSIQGVVYKDSNSNNTYDTATESGLSSITVNLYDENGTSANYSDDTLVATTASAGSGGYAFSNISAAAGKTYRIQADSMDTDLPAGATIGTTNPLTGVTVANGGMTANQNFGFDMAASACSAPAPSGSNAYINSAVGWAHNQDDPTAGQAANHGFASINRPEVISAGAYELSSGLTTGLTDWSLYATTDSIPATVAEAISSNKYIQYGFTTESPLSGENLLYGISMATFAPGLGSNHSGVYKLQVQIDDNPAFTSPTVVKSSIQISESSPSTSASITEGPYNYGVWYYYSHYDFDTPVSLAPNTSYYVRLYPYNDTLSGFVGGQSNRVMLDDTQLKVHTCNLGNIRGTVYTDSNANNSYDSATEKGISAIKVSLFNNTTGTLITTTSSAIDGSYSFSGLDTSLTYKITVDTADTDLPAGTSIGTTNPLTGVTVPAGGTVANNNFGFDIAVAASKDYGDAPATYGDASHTIVAGIYLGDNAPDAETASDYSFNARADNYDDGAPSQNAPGAYIPLFPVLQMTDTSYSAGFKVTDTTGTAAKLYGWIDFDKSGTFEADEAASVNVPNGSNGATVTLNWASIPADIKLGTTIIRLRLTTDAGVTTSTPTGNASNGEVEDYPIAVAMDIPPNSPSVSIVSGATPAACEAVVFQDNFNDLSTEVFWGPNRSGSQSIRNWTASGGGAETYARTVDSSSLGMGTSIYFGNGAVRRISPAMGTGFSFDANGKLLTVIDAIALRDDIDDTTPGTQGTGFGSESDWGPQPVTFSRTFATTVGKTYRLYFKAIPEDIGTNGFPLDGAMRLDVPGGSIHFKIPKSSGAVESYAVEFTAVNTTSTINFVNYGHFEGGNAGYCDPNSVYNANAWCTVGGSTAHANELIIDDVVLAEAGCESGSISGTVYTDSNGNNILDASEAKLPNITVKLYNSTKTTVLQTTSTNASGAYSLSNVTVGTYQLEVDTGDTDLPAGASIGTTNPLNSVAVTANTTTTNQNFGFDTSLAACSPPTPTTTGINSSITWNHNPFTPLSQILGGHHVPAILNTTLIASATNEVISNLTTGPTVWELYTETASVPATLAQAISGNKYFQYSFTTKPTLDNDHILYGVSMSTLGPLSTWNHSGKYKMQIQVDDNAAFSSPTVLMNMLQIDESNPTTGGDVSEGPLYASDYYISHYDLDTPMTLAANKTYYLRFYLYDVQTSGVGDGISNRIIFDDLLLKTHDCGAPPATLLSINDAVVTEGDSGLTYLNFPVQLSAAAPFGGVSFDYATADGTATLANNDYQARSGTLTIPMGASGSVISVPVVGDTNIEANETIPLNVTNVTNALYINGGYPEPPKGVILNDDAAVACNASSGHFGGIVFQDYNQNGLRESGETGLAGITVIAYNSSNTAAATATTDADGWYKLTGLTNGAQYRLEFTNLPSGAESGSAGTHSASNVQFVTVSASCDANLGVYNPVDYCQADPKLLATRYVNGDTAVGTANMTGSFGALLSYNYSASGIAPAVNQDALGSQVGSVWGLAYNRHKKKAFASAMVRRHIGLGPLGIGGIYVVDYSGASPVVSNFLNVDGLAGIDVGSIGTNASRGLSGDPYLPSHDPTAFDKVAKEGLGDAELSDDGNTLYVTNLYSRKIIKIDLTAYNTSGTIPATATQINLPAVSCTNGVARPFGLKYYRGKLHAGITCTGETGGSSANLKASIHAYDGSSWTEKLQVPLNYQGWHADHMRSSEYLRSNIPWVSSMSQLTFGDHGSMDWADDSQLLLSGIEFDTNGDMLLGFIDRTGLQFGNYNYGTDTSSTRFYGVFSNGELLKASYNGSTGAYTLENAGTANGIDGEGVKTGTDPAWPYAGPGGGEFYGGEKFTGHTENSYGALALVPGKQELALNAMNPFNITTGGTIWLDNNSGRRTRGVQLYGDDTRFFGKAVGLGDLEVLCDPAPTEVGNRVWLDSDSDGLQDAGESGINAVTVTLACGSDSATATTNAAGEYYFSNKTGGNATFMNAGENCTLKVNSSQASLSGQTLTTQNADSKTDNNRFTDISDSDAVNNAGTAEISFTVGSTGQNNHGLDFGYQSSTTTSTPPAPSCPAGALLWQYSGDINSDDLGINGPVYFTGLTQRRILNSAGLPAAFAETVGVNVNISQAITWDTGTNRVTDGAQPNEKVRLVFLKNGVAVGMSGWSADLADTDTTAAWTGSLGTLTLPNGADEVWIAHWADPTYGTGDTSNYNSLRASSVCIEYTPVTTGTITGTVYLDANGDDQYNAGSLGSLRTDLLALYDFQTGSGTTVTDVSGVGSAMNLTIPDPTKVQWLSGGGLKLTAATRLSAAADTKLHAALQATNEVTMEAWIKPGNLTQTGPGRIMTLSADTANRNMTLGQEASAYHARLRTTSTDNNGLPVTASSAGKATTALQHVVYTRAANGLAQIYVDGVVVATSTVAGDFSNWNSAYNFALGDEFGSTSRAWLGEYHKVAIYKRALTASEVSSQYSFGKGAVTLGEEVIPNIKVTLLNHATGVEIATTDTAADGSYHFNALESALTYRLAVDTTDTDLPAGSAIGTTNPLTNKAVTAGGTLANQNFGFDLAASSNGISGKVWFDSNKDGVQNDGADAYIEGAKVELYNPATSSIVATTTTNATGEYQFTSASGMQASTNYQLRLRKLDTQTPLAAWSLATLNAGGDDALDSDASLSGNYWVINVTSPASGNSTSGYAFGFTNTVVTGCLDAGSNGISDESVVNSHSNAYDFLFGAETVTGYCAEKSDQDPQSGDNYLVNASDRQSLSALKKEKLSRGYSALADPDIIFQIASVFGEGNNQSRLDDLMTYITWFHTHWDENLTSMDAQIASNGNYSAAQQTAMKSIARVVIDRINGTNGQTQYQTQNIFWLWNMTSSSRQDIVVPAIYAAGSSCATGKTVSGKVFEDVNYGGGAGRSISTPGIAGILGVRVELYDSTGVFVTSTNTLDGGPYSFSNVANGNYYVRVVNDTIRSTRAGSNATERAIQTHRTDGTTAVNSEVGGRNPAVVDAAANTTNQTLDPATFLLSGGGQAQSVQPITIASSDITGANFGFNFSTVVNTNDSGQGSLRQTIINANLLANSMAQPGSDYGFDTSLNKEVLVFNIPASGDPLGRADICGSTTCKIVMGTSYLPDITSPLIIDGTTQPGYTAGTPGVPRIQIVPNVTKSGGAPGVGLTFAAGGSDSTIRGLSIAGSTAVTPSNPYYGIYIKASRVIVESNYLGFAPDSSLSASGTMIFFDTTAATPLTTQRIGGTSADKRNIISGYNNGASNYGGAIQLSPSLSDATIQNNYIGVNPAGTAVLGTSLGTGIDVSGSADIRILDNIISGFKAPAIEIDDGTSGAYNPPVAPITIQRNRIGVGINGEVIGTTTWGISNWGTPNPVVIEENIIAHHTYVGVINRTSYGNSPVTISRNSIYANGKLGIDLNNVNTYGDGVTVNDANDVDTGANGLLNFPMLLPPTLAGGNLSVQGCAPAGATVELFEADVSVGGAATAGANTFAGFSKDYGEGQTYLANFVEGSGADTNTADCTLPNDTDGNSQTGMKAFTITIPTPAGFVTGDTLTATATLAASGTSEFSPTITLQETGDFTGNVFEDVNYGGGAGRAFGTAGTAGITGARVELYDATGNFVSSTTTDSSGIYSFASIVDGDYYVRVVNDTVKSTRAGSNGTERAIQTFRTDGTTDVINEVGGRNPAVADAAANTTNQTLNTTTFTLGSGQAQSVQPVTLLNGVVKSASVAENDSIFKGPIFNPIKEPSFGFNFSTVVNTNDSGQGSLRQAITNTNLLANTGMAQPGSTYGFDTTLSKEVLIFNIPASGDPLGRADICGAASCTITVSTKLPNVTAPLIIDGTTQPGYVAGTPGVPRIQIKPIAGLTATGIEIHQQANDSTVRGLSLTGFGVTSTNTALLIWPNRVIAESNYIGVTPDGTASVNGRAIALASGGGTPTTKVMIGGATPDKRNIISGFTGTGIVLGYSKSEITIQNNFIGTNPAGTAALSGGWLGIDVENSSGVNILDNIISGMQTGNNTIEIDDLSDSYGFASPTLPIIIRGNRIGVGINGEAIGNNGKGIMNYGTPNPVIIGGTAAGQGNIIAHNKSNGIVFSNNPVVAINYTPMTLSRNSIYANSGLGIDLGWNTVSLNDANDTDTGVNDLLNFPMLSEISENSGNLIIKGCAPAGATVELFEADVSTGGKATPGDNKLGKSKDYGEGQTYLDSFVEGGATDTDATNCALATDTDGNNQTGMNAFSVTIPKPASLADGDLLTTTATLTSIGTSEFSPVYTHSTACKLVVTTTADTDNPANNSGSLRDAIECANTTPGSDTITFNMPTTEAGFTNPAGTGNDYWSILLSSQLPSITEAVTIDGRTQTSNKGNTNSGNLAAATNVGVDNVILPEVVAPEVEIVGQWFGAGFDIKASNVSIFGLGMRLFDTDIRLDQANTTGALFSGMAFGVDAVSGADPGAGKRSNQHIAVNASGVSFILTNSVLGYNDTKRGIVTGEYNNVADVSAIISGNHFVGVGLSGNTENAAIEILRTQNPAVTISGNRFVGRGKASATDLAIEFNDYGGGNASCATCLVENNDISGFHDGVGYFTDASLTGLNISKNRIHDNAEFAVFLGNVQNATVSHNHLYDNGKSGVLINKDAAKGNVITANRIYNNGEVGINLAGGNQVDPGGITLNDASDADTGPNGLLNFPVLQQTTLASGNVTVRGCAPAGAVIEFFEADVSAGGAAVPGANSFGLSADYGEGQTYLGSLAEGGAADTDNGNCAIPGTDGNNHSGMKAFQFSTPVPVGLAEGDYLTATATITATGTSEFGPALAVIGGPPTIGAGSCAATGGSDILFIVDNSGSITPAEYADFSATIQQVGAQLLADNPVNRIAVTHFGGPTDSLVSGGQHVYIERDFSTTAMTAPVRQFGTNGAYNVNWWADHLAGAVQQMRYALDGNAATKSSYIVSPLKEMARNTATPLQIVLMTDAVRYGDWVPDDISMLIDPAGSGAEPNDGSNFTIYNQLKVEGVAFSVVSFNPEPTDIAASAAIASVGGTYTGAVETNPQDPEGSQTTPRRYVSVTSGFHLTAAQIEDIVEGTAICSSAISGTVFEDVNYGGGNGRAFGTDGTIAVAGATVEVYDNAGAYVASVSTSADGSYKLPNLPDANYYVRVVSDTVKSSRTGSNGSEIPVPTWRSNGTTPTANEIGGRKPSVADAGYNSGSSSLNTSTLVFSGGTLAGKQAQAIQLVSLSGSSVRNADFGFNFSTVVNTNDSGQGSLRQFLTNANLLGGDASLAQSGRTAGVENAILMLPANDPNYNGTDNYWNIALQSPLPAITSQLLLDGTTQNGFVSVPVLHLDGTNAGAANGLSFATGADNSLLKAFSIEQFGGAGILLDGAANVLIGGTNSGTGNVITGNTGDGIAVSGDSSLDNAILGNSIYGNGGLGIDLADNGVSANDAGDGDSGPNDLLNFPDALEHAFNANGTKIVTYDLDLDVPVGDYRLEFFVSSAKDPSGNGEGQTFIGYKDIAVTKTGNQNIKGTFNANQTVASGAFISSTITLKNGGGSYGATSEFSGVKAGTPVAVCTDLVSGTGGDMVIDENATSITLLRAKDSSGNRITYAITGGADKAMFAITAPVSGATLDCATVKFLDTTIIITKSASEDGNTRATVPPGFLPPPGNFEIPRDANGDNVYDFQITATYSDGTKYVRDMSLQVADVNEAPFITSAAAVSYSEDSTAKVIDIASQDPDAGTSEGNGLTYNITGGADAAWFSVAPATGIVKFRAVPDYDAPVDADRNNVYEVEVTVTDSGGLSGKKTFTVTVVNNTLDDGVLLKVRALMQGPYNAATGLMNADLNSLGQLPVKQPYDVAPFSYAGTETFSTLLKETTGNNAVVDWMLVELRSSLATVVASRAVMLQRDGDLVDAQTGSTDLHFASVPPGNYYVSVRHRNHLDILSASTVTLSSTPKMVDFSLKATLVKGSHTRLESGSLALMWAGDINGSQTLASSGPGNDVTALLSSIISDANNPLTHTNHILGGYSATDINLDGKTLFTGPGNDANLLVGNIILHPLNTDFAGNYIVKGGLAP